MKNWEKIKKIDPHVHILANERRAELISNYGEEDAWAKVDIEG
ncbi:MAG: hypothetical protein ACRCST_05530 [Turicibacter sp.]